MDGLNWYAYVANFRQAVEILEIITLELVNRMEITEGAAKGDGWVFDWFETSPEENGKRALVDVRDLRMARQDHSELFAQAVLAHVFAEQTYAMTVEWNYPKADVYATRWETQAYAATKAYKQRVEIPGYRFEVEYADALDNTISIYYIP